ncbi:MAG: PASTA domain-containing protein [bacterium]
MKNGKVKITPPPGSTGSRYTGRKKRGRPTMRRVSEARKSVPRLVSSRKDPHLGPSKDEKQREARSVRVIVWLGLTGLLILSCCLLAWQTWMFVSGNKAETIVPNLVGMSFQQAAVETESAQLVLRIRTETFTDDVEADLIIDQLPVPESSVKLGREIFVDVSLGPRTLTTPNLIGLDRNEAIAQLDSLGIANQMLVPQYSDVAPLGTVINQKPGPGEPIAVGEAVDIITSSGPINKAVTVPQLEGQPYEKALELIRDSRLVLRKVSRIYQAGATEEIVYSQFPLAGGNIMQGSEVLLTLACPVSGEQLGARSFKVSANVPQSSGTVRVRITVQDRYETKEVYSSDITGPATVEQLINSIGRTTVRIFFNSQLVREESF